MTALRGGGGEALVGSSLSQPSCSPRILPLNTRGVGVRGTGGGALFYFPRLLFSFPKTLLALQVLPLNETEQIEMQIDFYIFM